MRKPKHWKLWTVLAIIAAVLVLLVVCNLHLLRMIVRNVFPVTIEIDESEWEGGTSYIGVVYAEDSESQYLNLYVPDTDSDEEVPLIILVHGGGFILNDLECEQPMKMYQYFRDHGYACATINYRLAQEEEWPGAVEDVKAAIRYLRANAEVYGYSADDFTIWGESAGAYIATMAAVTDDDEFDGVSFVGEDDLEEEVSAEVSTLVEYYGCLDVFVMDDEFTELGIPLFVHEIANSWLDKDILDGYDTVQEFWFRRELDDFTEEEALLYKPIYYLEKNAQEKADLEIYIWHGNYDLTVPYLQTVNFASAAAEILGEDAVYYELFDGYVHADDRFYTEEQLDELLALLQG